MKGQITYSNAGCADFLDNNSVKPEAKGCVNFADLLTDRHMFMQCGTVCQIIWQSPSLQWQAASGRLLYEVKCVSLSVLSHQSSCQSLKKCLSLACKTVVGLFGGPYYGNIIILALLNTSMDTSSWQVSPPTRIPSLPLICGAICRPVKDMNEVTFHGLETILVHLHNTKGQVSEN